MTKEELKAEREKDHENINLKADFIDKTINDCAALSARVEALEVELRHCVYELERDGSRQIHRTRRAALARAELKGETK